MAKELTKAEAQAWLVRWEVVEEAERQLQMKAVAQRPPANSCRATWQEPVWEHIDLNLGPVDGHVPLGACRDIRQAITLGTDCQAMVGILMKGKTSVWHSFVSEEHWAYPPDDMLVRTNHDPPAAAAVLAGLGFVDEDGDGVREAKRDITCTITTDIEGHTKDQLILAGTRLELTLNTTSGNVMGEYTTLLFLPVIPLFGRVNVKFRIIRRRFFSAI